MSLANNLDKMNEITSFVTDRFHNDESFRALVQSGDYTNADLEKSLGFNFAGGSQTNLRIEDQTDANTIYLNIPRSVDLDSVELSEQELEAVSGGSGWTTIPCGVVAVVITTWDAVDGFIEGMEKAYNE